MCVAEDTGLIVPLGEQIISKAIRNAGEWHRHGIEFGKLSINASSTQLRDTQFVSRLSTALSENNLPGELLAVEILETVLVDHDDTIVSVVEELRQLGISIELDDFGTGHTSIINVNRLNVNRIKIDRSLIDQIVDGNPQKHVVKAILEMARALNVKVIAEGIETDSQQQQLIRLGCTEGQGYLFAKPMGADDIRKELLETSEYPTPFRRAS
jgi:EAL domain-containing protein (putative c-di-GMP-specific phosphodiesterase class I)